MNYSHNHTRYLNLYFQVHQPKRLRSFRFFDIGSGSSYFDESLNEQVVRDVARRCYLPTNILLLKLIYRYPKIRIAFSISGVVLEQLEKYAPAVIESFRMMAATGCVEFLSETYHHSLAALISKEEFDFQVCRHAEKIEQLLGVRPTVFRNTELIYSDHIGELVHQLGFKGVMIDGVSAVLGSRSPRHVYSHPGNGLKLLLRDYGLSDDIAFRFSENDQSRGPLTAKKYVQWLENIPEHQALVNLGMDYETFGEHHKADSGIFQFLEEMLSAVVKHGKYKMVTPSEAIDLVKADGKLSIPTCISWADEERDLSAWLGNDMQRDAFKTLLQMGKTVLHSGDKAMADVWRNLQTSDHFYYMSTKKGADGNVHSYFSHYPSPYEAFINYMNVLSDFEIHLKAKSRTLVARETQKAFSNASLFSGEKTKQLVA
jgi:alpha-amylase